MARPLPEAMACLAIRYMLGTCPGTARCANCPGMAPRPRESRSGRRQPHRIRLVLPGPSAGDLPMRTQPLGPGGCWGGGGLYVAGPPAARSSTPASAVQYIQPKVPVQMVFHSANEERQAGCASPLWQTGTAAAEAMGTSGPCGGVQESTAERSEVGGDEVAGRANGGQMNFGAVVEHKLTLQCIF